MSGEWPHTTWDGLPVAPDKPYAVAVLVWRAGTGEHEWLVLHRAHEGPDYAGDWAWTPPAGARLPGETPEEAAVRELMEEAGLAIPFEATSCGNDDVVVFQAEAPADARIVLSPEHDDYAWLSLDEARARCLPALVSEQYACVARLVSG